MVTYAIYIMIKFYEKSLQSNTLLVTLVIFWDIFILDINIFGALYLKKGFSLKH